MSSSAVNLSVGKPIKTTTQLPNWLTYAIVMICIAPFLLNLLGISFASHTDVFDLQKALTLEHSAVQDAIFNASSGSYIHTLLEWSAFMCAILTVILALTTFSQSANITILVLSIALFFSGVMDGFHTLAADRLISVTAHNQDLLPFTWAISRSFNSLILLIGASVFLFASTQLAIKTSGVNSKVKIITVFGSCFIMGLIAFSIIHISSTSLTLPQTQFPQDWISRPYDVLPGLIYLLGMLVIFPRFYQKYPSVFSHALLISMVPQIMTQLHMALGSAALFDNDFNIGHFLKILAYLVPFLGLCIDYHNKQITLREEIVSRQIAQEELKHAYDDLELKITARTAELTQTQELFLQQNKVLQRNSAQLESSNQELEQFAFIASHDLKEPLRKITTFGERLTNKYALDLPEQGQHYLDRMIAAAKRMDTLIQDLLNYSRVASKGEPFLPVNLRKVAVEMKELLENRIEDTGALIEIGELPVIEADRVQIKQVFQNLLSNALKYRRQDVPPVIKIEAEIAAHHCQITFEDNGQGFDDEQALRIFQPFQRLHGRQVEGTGMGLAIVKKVIERHKGTILAFGKKDQGAKFVINLPLKQDSEPQVKKQHIKTNI